MAAPIADVAGMGFAHCRYGLFEGRERGEWTLFIVEDMIPKGLIGPVAIHERGEEISLGNHFFASQLEFAWARWDPKLSLNKYIDWIDKEYPNKFIDLTQKVLFPVLPQELLDFFSREGKRSAQELQKAEDLIRQYPLPDRALKLMERYENETLLFCEAVRYRIGRTQDKLFNMSLKGELTPKKAAEIAHKELRNALLGFTPEEARVISRARAKEVLEVFHNIVGRDAYKFTNRHLNTPVDLGVAYKDAMNRRRLVNVIKTAEDLAREGKST